MTLCHMQAAAEILGKRKGEQMAMLVHHSRNSVQKQWEETLVLALSGMGRILRAHLPVLVAMPGFAQVPAHVSHPLLIACLATRSRVPVDGQERCTPLEMGSKTSKGPAIC